MSNRMPYNDEEYVLEYSHKPKIQIKGNTYYFPINSDRFLTSIALAVLFAPVYIIIGYFMFKQMQYKGILVLLIFSLPVLWLIASYLFDGIYINPNKDKVFYLTNCVLEKLKFESIEAIVIVNHVVPDHPTRSPTPNSFNRVVDVNTKEPLYTAFVVKKYYPKMSWEYYNSMTFKRDFYFYCFAAIYQEEMIKLILKKNPNIRIINKTMGELKMPFLENLENKVKE